MGVARTIYGVFGSAAPIASQAYVADRTTPEQRTQAMSLLASAQGLGTVIGPALAPVFVLPLIAYNVATGPLFGLDEIEVGRDIGVGFSVLTMLLWGSTYIFRVATKDMTYARQLKDYEDAVIAKRLEELDDDEVQALVEDIERERF